MQTRVFRKGMVFVMLSLFLTTNMIPTISGATLSPLNPVKESIAAFQGVDIEYIKNITKALCDIIFTEYNETAGELAKGRAFGTKGEHKAADILYENMSKLGLHPVKEQINDAKLTHSFDIETYHVILRNSTSNSSETLDCCVNSIQPDTSLEHGKVYCFNYSELKIRKWPTSLQGWINARTYDKQGEPYVFISEVEGRLSRDPDPRLPLGLRVMNLFFYPIRVPSIGLLYVHRDVELVFLHTWFKNCKGTIPYDFTPDTHDTAVTTDGRRVPMIYVNGTIWNKIYRDVDNYTIDFFLQERYNASVVSYNVIGTWNGTERDKTVLVDCFYDCVWCQGAGDSAIGMGIVMGLAKYFTENNITPRYTIKFIGFGGEEPGALGAKYYEATHKNETILYVIDMNQVCSKQTDPGLALNVIFNKYSFMRELWTVVKRTQYAQRVGNTSITKRWWPLGAPSDDNIFAMWRPGAVNTVCFLEDFPWLMHHRDGMNHTAGDVFSNLDWNKTRVVSELVLNVTEHLTVIQSSSVASPFLLQTQMLNWVEDGRLRRLD